MASSVGWLSDDRRCRRPIISIMNPAGHLREPLTNFKTSPELSCHQDIQQTGVLFQSTTRAKDTSISEHERYQGINIEICKFTRANWGTGCNCLQGWCTSKLRWGTASGHHSSNVCAIWESAALGLEFRRTRGRLPSFPVHTSTIRNEICSA